MIPEERAFPADFVWGTATAAYQIEGAAHEDGRSESIWDRFAAIPGKVRNGETGLIADDHYHRYASDIALLRDLGVGVYRFSVAWPRILPDGRGAVNERGLDFYDRLVDELLRAGIEPYVTLYHWDLPQVLEDAGGWPNRDTTEAFTDYAGVVARRLGDRVKNWITHNEPWCASWLGYGWGVHAPGRTNPADALAAAHHLLLSHGQAVPVIRGEVPGARVGITLNLEHKYPATNRPEDVAAARLEDGVSNRWFLDPIFLGTYPDDVAESFAGWAELPDVRDGDLETISAPIDFLGINNYSRAVVKADPKGMPARVRQDESEYTSMGWEVAPDGLHDLLLRVHHDYRPAALYVTENGAAFEDVRTHDGAVNDPERQAFLERYIGAVGRAAADGAPIKGYFVWSFLDNFEWAEGYAKRFGLVYVDYPTLQRIPKKSYYWYRQFIARQPGHPQAEAVA
ncbi:MAG TPA: GH1 family beta-glucosidase [Chloroflexota bacterium]|nr:GH1 family beta-glucosidase [Chloroflexota bacterium]